MRLFSSRIASFVLIVLLYIAASVLGMILYALFPFAAWLKLLLADCAATVFIFFFSLLFSNASVYDPYWSVQPIVILGACAFIHKPTLIGLCLLACVVLWGVRLTANWAYTFNGLKHQDWRYTMLKEQNGKLYPLVNFFGIHLFPTLIVYLCVLPAFTMMLETPEAGLLPLLPLFLCLIAVFLQATADWQMQMFRKAKSGGLIRTGLWKYARHPNYLGEILMWWGVGLCAVLAMPEKYYLLAGALANTLMFLFVSIPMADKRQSKKEGYDTYRAQTRALLPIPKKAK